MIFYLFIGFLLIPILLHLFKLRKTKKVVFPTIFFLKNAVQSKRGKLKNFLKLLLLATRLLFFSLVLFLVYKYVKSSKNQLSRTDSFKSVVFDNSLSSSISVGDNSFSDYVKSLISPSEYSSFNLFTHSLNFLDDNSKTDFSSIIPESSKSLNDLLKKNYKLLDNDVLIFSDFQHLSLNELKNLKSDSSKKWKLIVNDLSTKTNCYVDSLYLVNNLSGNSLTVNVKIASSGVVNNDRNLIVKLFDGNNQLSSVVKKIEENFSLSFDISALEFSENLRVVLNGDDVDFDNIFYFNFNKKNLNYSIVLLGMTENKFISNVYANKNLFDFHFMQPNQLNYDLLEAADLVILDELLDVPSILNSLDKTFLIIANDKFSKKSYEDFMNIKLKINTDTASSELAINLNSVLFGNKIFRNTKNITFPSTKTFFETNTLVDKLIKTRNGSSFLFKSLSRPVFFMNCSLQKDYTSLVEHSFFVPLMYQIAFQSKNTSSKSYFYPNQELILKKVKSLDSPVKLIGKNFEVIPEINHFKTNTLIKIPDNIQSGGFKILHEKDTLVNICVNQNKHESMLKTLSFEEISSFFRDSPHVKVYKSKDVSSINNLFTQQKKKYYLEYVLILALLFILFETFVHRYFK